MAVDYKSKYLDLRAKFLEATDVSYRLGMEEGMKKGQDVQKQVQEQANMEQEKVLAMQNGEIPPGAEEGEMPPEMEGEVVPEEIDESEGSGNLDEHIAELESLVAKGEKPSVLNMRKAVGKLSELRKTQKDKRTKKDQKTASAQKKFVDKIIKSWDKSSEDVTEDLEDIIKEHGIKLEE